MDEFKSVTKTSSVVKISSLLEKIYKKICESREKNVLEHNIKEIEFLKTQCKSDVVQLSLMSCQTFVRLVVAGVLDANTILTMLISMLPNSRQPINWAEFLARVLLLYTFRTVYYPSAGWNDLHMLEKITNTFYLSKVRFHVQRSIASCCCEEDEARPKIYLTRPDYASVGIDILKSECDVSFWKDNCPVPKAELLKNIAGKSALFCCVADKVDKSVLDAAGPELKVVATLSVGFEHIDVNECKKRGIRVGYTPGILTDATAELTVTLLLATTRRIFEANKEVFNGGWKSWAPGWMCGQSLMGSTLGMFGFGRIGNGIAERLIPFKPECLIYANRSEREEAAALGFVKVSFDELVSQSDFIVVCCALTPETRGIFNKAAFAKMKPNTIFVNSARGAVVDQPALVEALQQKKIMGAGLDVTTPEPLPLDHPLLKLDNVVILPHIGSADTNTRTEMSKMTACNILAGLNGEAMPAEI